MGAKANICTVNLGLPGLG